MTELAAELGVSSEDIVFAMDAIQSPVSLYEPVYTEGGDTLSLWTRSAIKKTGRRFGLSALPFGRR